MADNYASNNTLAHTPARCGVDPHARVHGVAVLVTVRLWSGGVTLGHSIGVQPTHAVSAERVNPRLYWRPSGSDM
jgi:hypothetical protein